jgi:hypothetical protein
MDSNETDDTTQVPMEYGEVEIEPQGFLDRIVNIYLEPSTLFRYLTVKPDFWTPWIVVGILMVVVTFFTIPVTRELGVEQQIQIMQQSGADEEEITKTAEMMEKMETVSMIIGIVLAAVAPLIGWLISGAVVFLISLIQGLEASFKRVFSVMAYTSMISILGGGVIDKIIKLAKGASTLTEWERSIISFAAILPANAHKSFVFVLSSIDPFLIWSLVVMAIGLRFVNKCRMKSAIITVIIYFVILLIFLAGWGFVQQLLTPGGSEGGVSVTVSA